MHKRILVALFLLVAGIETAPAASAYRCSGGGYVVAFQDHPCDRGQTQHVMRLPDAAAEPAAAATAAPVAATPVEASTPLPPTAPAAPAIPPPAFYLCTRYDGSHYESADGVGDRHAMPLAMLGVPSRSLADAYGGPNGIGVSAPGLRQPPTVPAAKAPLGASYVWVQDPCHATAPREACAYLRSELDDVDDRLLRAFSDTEAQLKRQQATLRERLRGC